MKGILFQEELFGAVIQCHKTQTRRIGGLDSVNSDPDKWVLNRKQHGGTYVKANKDLSTGGKIVHTSRLFVTLDTLQGPYLCRAMFPKYQVGDIVYLKEPLRIHAQYDDKKLSEIEKPDKVFYRYPNRYGIVWDCVSHLLDKFGEWEPGKWRNKMFMPASYARYFIRILV